MADPKHIRENHAGVIESRRRRATGAVVTVYVAKAQGLDASGGAYATVCEDHGEITNHKTIAQAKYHAPVGGGCEECARIISEEV